MNRCKTFIYLLPFLALGCNSSENNNQVINSIKPSIFNVNKTAEKTAKWTVMVYISGDNDLEEYVVKDIENELAAAGSTKEVQIVAIADRIPGFDSSRGNWTSTKLFHISKGMKANSESAVADWGERNFGDPKTLLNFVNWSKINYPADRYALYMWGHGWNWRKGFTMEDKTNKDSLDPAEVKSILPDLGLIDMVAYDGCNMASIEVEALWHGHSSAIVHSQEYVEWDGIEYDIVLKKLNENPNLTADQLAVITNQSAATNSEKTGSAIALDKRWNIMLKSFDEWSDALKDGLEKNRKGYDKAFLEAQHFYDVPDDKDLYDLVSKVNQYVDDPVLEVKGKNLMLALKKVTLDEWHNEKEYPNAHGITISKLSAKDSDKTYYKTLDFSITTSWNEFLDLYKN